MNSIKFLILFLLIDIFLSKNLCTENYCFNHFLCSLFVCLFTIKDVVVSYTDFDNCEKYESHSIVVSLIYGLYIYHCLYYYKKLKMNDIFHYISTLCICVPLSLLYNIGSLLGYYFFFTFGLPEMINYFLLWKERNGLYKRQKQKKYCFSVSP